jgi:hypothetical protein
MKRTVKIGLIALAGFAVLVYTGDYISLRYRIRTGMDPLGTVKVQSYYAIKKKNGTTEFVFNDPEDQTCVHSLFPHLGQVPCWYLSRHQQQRIDE